VYGTSSEYRKKVASSPWDEWWKKTMADAVMEINGKPVELDPYGHLVFVAGGVINKNAPVKDPWIIRFVRAYLDGNMAAWNWLRANIDWIWVPALVIAAIVSVIMNGGTLK